MRRVLTVRQAQVVLAVVVLVVLGLTAAVDWLINRQIGP